MLLYCIPLEKVQQFSAALLKLDLNANFFGKKFAAMFFTVEIYQFEVTLLNVYLWKKVQQFFLFLSKNHVTRAKYSLIKENIIKLQKIK